VDNGGDSIVELANQGSDSVFALIDWALGANLESLFLTGSAIRGTGNELSNSLWGNDVNNVLDGAGGADILTGGRGDNTYIVDIYQDVITELSGEGADQVLSSASFYFLSDNVENLELLGTSDISGYGNSLNNLVD
jgi:Ca2+-binding RTX toxin-like protein